MEQSLQYIQHLLGLSDTRILEDAVSHLGRVVGKNPKTVLEQLIEDNEDRFNRRIAKLGYPRERNAEPTYGALLQEVGKTEKEVAVFFEGPRCNCGTDEGMENLFALALAETPYKRGFFMRPEIAADFLMRHPPRGLLSHLEYPGVSTMLEHENIFELYGALRFSEDREWMGEQIELYRGLKPTDFEERDITVIKMDRKKWYPLAKEYIEKKYHNLSHSKEMGVIFLVPTPGQFAGLNLRALALLFHYLAEVHFYASLFARAAFEPTTFGEHLTVAITGDVPEAERVRREGDHGWYILQRYVAKDPLQDVRFSRPHVMPEAVHWKRAFLMLNNFAKCNHLETLATWDGHSESVAKRLKWAGEEVIVTLNVEDLIFSYAKQLPVERSYTYHWRESFWNRIFSAFVGEEEMIQLMERDLYHGVIGELT
ncbi:MAG: hypothetical protein Q7S89_00660 [bacterium]|nr:hypothetical protein [bacterium]